jgi:hypothetical protein
MSKKLKPAHSARLAALLNASTLAKAAWFAMIGSITTYRQTTWIGKCRCIRQNYRLVLAENGIATSYWRSYSTDRRRGVSIKDVLSTSALVNRTVGAAFGSMDATTRAGSLIILRLLIACHTVGRGTRGRPGVSGRVGAGCPR